MNELDLSRNVGRCQKYLHNISFALDFYPSFVSKQCNTHLKWQQETIAWLFLPGNSSKIKKKTQNNVHIFRAIKSWGENCLSLSVHNSEEPIQTFLQLSPYSTGA